MSALAPSEKWRNVRVDSEMLRITDVAKALNS
jgi:hypothetical protein